MLHTIDDILRPLSASDEAMRQEPISVKKLRQGDAYWTTRKMVLGWIIDTVKMTLELPLHRHARLLEILATIHPGQKRTSTKKWHQLLGELRSMVPAIPGARGLFSQLQQTLCHVVDARIKLSPAIHDTIADFTWLAHDLHARPTRLYELVPPDQPTVTGSVDAAGTGMGGVAFPTAGTIVRDPLTDSTLNVNSPIVWRVPFPSDIQADLVSATNPQGTITNSDLETAGAVVHHDALAQNFDVRERLVHTNCDNVATISRFRKGSTTSVSAPAYLLRQQALHQRFHRYIPQLNYLPGPLNKLADDASRLWSLTNDEFLAYFNSTYPQVHSWRLWTPSKQTVSATISALRKQRSEPVLFLREPNPPLDTGKHGRHSVNHSVSTPICHPWKTPWRSSKSLLTDIERDQLLQTTSPSVLAQSRMPSGRSVKRSPVWGPKTPGIMT
jgi:hypothetical protein